MKKHFEILPPTMPNFVKFKSLPGQKQDGFKGDGYDIINLTEEEAKEYAELMKNAFIEHWRKRKDMVYRNNGNHKPTATVRDFYDK